MTTYSMMFDLALSGERKEAHFAACCADPQVHVGHSRDVFEHDGQARGVGQLLLRFVFDRHAARPHLDGHAAVGLFGVVVMFHVRLTLRSR